MMDMLPTDKMGTDTDVARAVQDARDAAERGFALPPTVVRFGIEVTPDGQDRFRQSHRDWEAMAPGGTVLDGLRAAVATEHRRDGILPLRELRMEPTGELCRRVGYPDPCGGEAREGRLLTESAWRQLMSLQATVKDEDEDDGEEGERRRIFPAGAALYLGDGATPRTRRAQDVGYHLGRAPAHARCLLRGRRSGADEQIYAVLGPRYATGADADKAAQLLKGSITKGARGQATYEDARWSVDMFWHSRLAEEARIVAGEVFKAGIRVESADNGTAGLRVRAALHRNLCRNFLIIDLAEKTAYTTHARQNLGDWLARQVAAANASLAPFLSRWNDANQAHLLGESRTDPGDAFGKLVELELLAPPPGSGLSDKEYVDRLVTAHRAEGGWTADPARVIRVADAVNAVSRAAHETSWTSAWQQQDQEAAAGELLYQKVIWGRAIEID